MSNQIYQIPTIPPDLWQEDTIVQIADTLQYLYQVTDDIFNRISSKVNDNHQRLNKVNDRVSLAQAKVEKLKGSNKATKVFACAKFPSADYLDEYDSVFRDKHNLNIFRKTHSRLQQYKHMPVDEKVLKEKLQYYNVHLNVKNKKREGEGEGLGRLPRNIPSVSTLLLFNTSENPYKKYVMLDPLGVVTKTRQDIGEEQEGLTEAPSSISKNEEIKRLEADNYFYVPSIGDVPEITAPTSLPDLPGVADDVSYMAEFGPSIAPSVPSSMPDLPTVVVQESVDISSCPTSIPLAATPDLGIGSSISAVAPSTALPPQTPPPPPPPPPTAAPPPAPPVPNIVSSKQEAETEVKTEQVAKSTDGRANLMDSIRKARGKAKQKKSKDVKTFKKKKDDIDTAADTGGRSGGGDLMGDLLKKLTMRREGISGVRNQRNTNKDKESAPVGGGNVMDKISAMIPPPKPVDDDDDDDENGFNSD